MSTNYTVKKGDSLWKIAKEHLGDGNRWKEIQTLNAFADDCIIYPDQVLKLPLSQISKKETIPNPNSKVESNILAMSITEKQFRNALEFNRFPKPSGNKYTDFMRACKLAEIDDMTEAAMFLAQLIHESGGLQYTTECFTADQSQKHYGKYIGRGYIQLSTEWNYRVAGEAIGYDYVNNPELVSTDPHAWLVSAWYWKSRVKPFVSQGFDATTTKGLAPLTPSHEKRRAIYSKVREAFGLNII